VLGVIFGAAYFLWYYERAMFGPLTKGAAQVMADLNGRELIIAVSLCVMIFWIGLYPAPFLRIMNGSIQALVERLEHGSVAERSSDVKREAFSGAPKAAPHASPLTPHEG
jgi:NADH-quinone oxidoreductase subunit M